MAKVNFLRGQSILTARKWDPQYELQRNITNFISSVMAYFSESETCCGVDDYDEIVDMFIIAAPSLLIDSAGLV